MFPMPLGLFGPIIKTADSLFDKLLHIHTEKELSIIGHFSFHIKGGQIHHPDILSPNSTLRQN